MPLVPTFIRQWVLSASAGFHPYRISRLHSSLSTEEAWGSEVTCPKILGKLDLDLDILPSSEVFLPHHKLEVSLIMGLIPEGWRHTRPLSEGWGLWGSGIRMGLLSRAESGQGCLYC